MLVKSKALVPLQKRNEMIKAVRIDKLPDHLFGCYIKYIADNERKKSRGKQDWHFLKNG